MNRIPNKQAVCDVLAELAETDGSICVLCSDSRGSGSMTDFAEKFPERFIEVGIAEQSLVSTAAGLASCGMKPVAVSPAAFLSTRSLEQIKVDVAYSHNNVILLGISGGISYGALGMTHHSSSDIADIASIPGMRVYFPSDRIQTKALIHALMEDNDPAYIRTGRNAVEDIYNEKNYKLSLNSAEILLDGSDLAIIACGETVSHALKAGRILAEQGISAMVTDMYCIKPIDRNAVQKAVSTGKIITVEEHVSIGGMGAMVSQIAAADGRCRVINLTLPDEPVVAGNSNEVFAYYGLDTDGIVSAAKKICGVV